MLTEQFSPPTCANITNTSHPYTPSTPYTLEGDLVSPPIKVDRWRLSKYDASSNRSNIVRTSSRVVCLCFVYASTACMRSVFVLSRIPPCMCEQGATPKSRHDNPSPRDPPLWEARFAEVHYLLEIQNLSRMTAFSTIPIAGLIAFSTGQQIFIL